MFGFLNNKNKLILDKAKVEAFNKVRINNTTEFICDAPFKSLLFIPTGELMVCHYNRGYKLGKYPDNSIDDIWFGRKLKELRQRIAKNDFSRGCFQCYNNLNNFLFSSSGPGSYDGIPSNDNGYPALLEFQLSNMCNLECVMCSGEYSSGIRINREKLKPYLVPYDDVFIEQLIPFLTHLKKVYFTGGEPLIIPLYRRIWDLLFKLNPNAIINISTNASIIDNEVKLVFEKGFFNFTVSIDTINPVTYKKIRKNAFLEQTIDNIKYLQNYSEKNKRLFSIKFVLIRQNLFDVPELFNYFNNQNVQIIPKIVELPFRHSLISLNYSQLKDAISFLENVQFEKRSFIQMQNIQRYNEMLKRLKEALPEVKRREDDIFFNTASKDDLKKYFVQRMKKEIEFRDFYDKFEQKNIMKEFNEIIFEVEKLPVDEESLKKAYYAFCAVNPLHIWGEILRGDKQKLIARFWEETN